MRVRDLVEQDRTIVCTCVHWVCTESVEKPKYNDGFDECDVSFERDVKMSRVDMDLQY